MPRLIVRDEFDERIVDLDQEVVTAGRSKKNAIPIRDEHSSREHCEVRRTPDGYMLVDLNSRNGTLVNGCPVNQHKLRHGDKIEVGDTLMIFTSGESRLEYIQRDTPAHLQGVGRKNSTGTGKDTHCSLTVTEGERKGEKVVLEKLPFSFGRNKTCSITFKDDRVSGKHAEIAVDEEGKYVLKDLGSTNGTFINNQKITKAVLKPGAIFEVGLNKMEFNDPRAPAREDRKTPPNPLPAAGGPGDHPKSPASPEGRGRGLEREHLLMVFAGVLSLVVVGGAYFLLPAVLRLVLGGAGEPVLDPSNLIAPDPGFERPDRTRFKDLFEGWRVSGTLGEQFAADAETFAAGRFALRLDSLDQEPRATEMACAYEKNLPVEAGQALVLSGQMRVRKARGLVGYRVTWLDAAQQPVGEDWSPVAAGDTAWQRVEGVFAAPEPATAARVACVGLGAFGQAWFDEVHLARRAIDPAKDRLEMTHGSLRLGFTPRGRFSISRGGTPLLWGGGIRVWTDDGQGLAQELATVDAGQPVSTEEDFSTQVSMVDPSSGGSVKISLATLVIDRRLSLNYRVEADEGMAVDQVEWGFTMRPERLKEGFVVATADGEWAEPGAFARTPGVVRLALGPAEGRLTIRFGTPAACIVRRAENYPQLGCVQVDSPAAGTKVFEFSIELD